MSLLYDVPVVSQTKLNDCWNAAAQMIWTYWQGVSHNQGPMNSLQQKFGNDQPIFPNEFVKLAQAAGLVKLVVSNPRHHYYGHVELEKTLRKYGPLWCAGKWYGQNHVIVLIGIRGHTILLNDPYLGAPKAESVMWFNTHLDKPVDGCIMYKNQRSY